ncbi:MAG: AAA family ATPase [Deltaproteobacteria bacterium]|nr:AAA family ATPase [Deltaproteobacteria bacterium]
MIKSLSVINFTAFSSAELEFGQNLNVFVGENGTGKTHLLKLAYALLAVEAQGRRDSGEEKPSETYLKGAVARKLVRVFRPDQLGGLVRRSKPCEGAKNGVGAHAVPPAQFELRHEKKELGLSFELSVESSAEVSVSKVPALWLDKAPAFFPTRELLSIYPGFVSLYETTELPFEETWRDTCVLLGAPVKRGTMEKKLQRLLAPLEAVMGGRVELDQTGRFYLVTDRSRREMPLVAEGLRKLGMLARLISTGALSDQACLFWDEPETNLNSKLIKDIARAVVELGQHGVQVFVATHSLFFLRELEIILSERKMSTFDTRFFGLQAADGGVSILQGPTFEDIGDIAALSEELEQSDRFMATEGRS